LDYEERTIIRREILPTGKSRAFINDSPVNLQELQELGIYLLDIHSQHQTRELTETAYQLEIIDAVANNTSFVALYQQQLTVLKAKQKQLTEAAGEKQLLEKEHEYNSYLLNELLAANLQVGEQEILEQELEQLSNVEFIKEQFSRMLSIANEEQIGAVVQLKEMKLALQKLSPFSTLYLQLYERLQSTFLEIEDLINEGEKSFDKINADPERIEYVNNKLQALYALQKKHQVQSIQELLVIRDQLDDKVLKVDDLEIQIKQLEQEVNENIVVIDGIALSISENRKQGIPQLVEKMKTILSQLGMAEANFQFDLVATDHYFTAGKDELNVLFSANKGTHLGPLKKVASGGEMSRIMLAVKSILAHYSKLPTIIFDEIDTGVSGEIAIKMGEIMKEMSATMQVFAITHLPQIAAKGDTHYKVVKRSQGTTTISELVLLSPEERITQIAEMLSGKEVSASALEHAKALLN
jgi:DNA repair protein RecN (Recombination protein N)